MAIKEITNMSDIWKLLDMGVAICKQNKQLCHGYVTKIEHLVKENLVRVYFSSYGSVDIPDYLVGDTIRVFYWHPYEESKRHIKRRYFWRCDELKLNGGG